MRASAETFFHMSRSPLLFHLFGTRASPRFTRTTIAHRWAARNLQRLPFSHQRIQVSKNSSNFRRQRWVLMDDEDEVLARAISLAPVPPRALLGQPLHIAGRQETFSAFHSHQRIQVSKNSSNFRRQRWVLMDDEDKVLALAMLASTELHERS